MAKKAKVAILGTGNIGTDLLIKVMRSSFLDCGAFIGRSSSSPGLVRAADLGVPISSRSLAYIVENPSCCDIVFDATSAKDHFEHAPILKQLGKFVIDLTPAKVGQFCIPAVNLQESLNSSNINMITCGGQASIPIAHAIGKVHEQLEYIEVISSIASRSAGPATRINLDEYIHTTEMGLLQFSGARKSKAVLILNPAQPCINMQTTIFAKIKNPNIKALEMEISATISRIQKYVPGYQLVLGPKIEDDRIIVMIRVKGLGDYLPEYAGNLDIINCAAIAVAESFAKLKAKTNVEVTHEPRAYFN